MCHANPRMCRKDDVERGNVVRAQQTAGTVLVRSTRGPADSVRRDGPLSGPNTGECEPI